MNDELDKHMTIINAAQTGISTMLLDNFRPLDNGQLLEAPGIRAVTTIEQKQEFYFDGAYVPDGDWVDISDQIVDATIPCDLDPTASVGLFNLPEQLRAKVASFMLSYAKTPAYILQRNEAIRPLRHEVRSYLVDRFQATPTELKLDLLGHNSPGLQTVTIDRRLGHKTGLHYDSWYGTSLNDRLCGRQRIVFNFGPVPRWFLFVPVKLQDFVSFMSTQSPGQIWDSHTPIRHINQALGALNPKVHCLKINPGQGYMAPTESVIHDATTRWAEVASVNMQLLGELTLAAFPRPVAAKV